MQAWILQKKLVNERHYIARLTVDCKYSQERFLLCDPVYCTVLADTKLF